MSMNQEQNCQKIQKDNKFFNKENIPAIIGLAVIIIVALYVISTHLDLPTIIVPSDAVEITYPKSILSIPAEEQAENMKNSEGIYKVKVNSEGGLDIKMSLEKYTAIKEAAKNAVETMVIISIGEETAIKDYKVSEDYTALNITVDPDIETLEKEISDAVYTVRLYHVSHMNNDAEIEVYYIDEENPDVAYKYEKYDIDGNVTGEAEGRVEYPSLGEDSTENIF